MRTKCRPSTGLPPRQRVEINRLAEMIRTVEGRGDGETDAAATAIEIGWPAVDDRAGGLAVGAVHEWFGLALPDGSPASPWTPPMCILSHLAWRAVTARPGRWVIWVGRACWPHPRVLVRAREGDDRRLLDRSLFVDPPAPPDSPDSPARLWAIDLALRSPAVAAVVADGRNLRLNETRRLQLAAEAGRTLALLARPPDETAKRSAVATRWVVRTAAPSQWTPFEEGAMDSAASFARQVVRAGPPATMGTDDSAGCAASLSVAPKLNPAWDIQLTRCKTRPEAARDAATWRLEWSGAKGVIPVSAGLVERPGQAKEVERGRRTA